MLEEALPFKYLITKEQRFGQFEIIGKNDIRTGLLRNEEKYFPLKQSHAVYYFHSVVSFRICNENSNAVIDSPPHTITH